jgi:hypothetical protein
LFIPFPVIAIQPAKTDSEPEGIAHTPIEECFMALPLVWLAVLCGEKGGLSDTPDILFSRCLRKALN